MFIDVKNPHLSPKCEEDVYLELPPECHCPKGYCGELNYWMYGMRGVASAWERHYIGKFESIGVKRGVSCGVVFYQGERDISLVVHGDDLTFCGTDRDFKWVRKHMEEWCEIAVRAILGPDSQDDKEVVMLGRMVRWTDNGIEYEADPRHRQIVVEYFDFSE
eukprot:8566220-Karenia_brevis.AAC.1